MSYELFERQVAGAAKAEFDGRRNYGVAVPEPGVYYTISLRPADAMLHVLGSQFKPRDWNVQIGCTLWRGKNNPSEYLDTVVKDFGMPQLLNSRFACNGSEIALVGTPDKKFYQLCTDFANLLWNRLWCSVALLNNTANPSGTVQGKMRELTKASGFKVPPMLILPTLRVTLHRNYEPPLLSSREVIADYTLR